jgi:hypothetical protein
MMITVRGSCGVVHSSFEEWQNCPACRAAEFKAQQPKLGPLGMGSAEGIKNQAAIYKPLIDEQDKLRNARKMWSGPFPELFTRDGEVRGIHRLMPRFIRFYRYMRRLGGSRWEAWTWALANLWARKS